MKTRETLLEEALDAAKELINECFDTTQETIFQHGLERLGKALALLYAAKEEPELSWTGRELEVIQEPNTVTLPRELVQFCKDTLNDAVCDKCSHLFGEQEIKDAADQLTAAPQQPTKLV